MKTSSILLMALASFACAAGAQARELTLEERVTAQTAIEQVYWNHRVWPKENSAPKPPLSAVMSAATIRARVEDYLRKSNALEKWWRRPITTEQLQAELVRMATASQDGATLQELYQALGNDAELVAETLARQTLVERLIRSWYAGDTRFHGELEAKAEASRAACASIDCMRSMSGEYAETTWKPRSAGSRPMRERIATTRVLGPEDWSEHLKGLATQFGVTAGSLPTCKLSGLEETSEAFLVTAVVSQRDGELTTASVSWPKRPFDAWWEAERGSIATGLVKPSGSYALRTPSAGCVNDSWTRTHFDLPDPRSELLAIWTGTEMFVWGGWTYGAKLRNGGRYNPATDTWTPVLTGPEAPDSGFYSSIVWTGTEIIIWGGFGNQIVNTGARYDPATDTWTRMSTGANVPERRYAHSVAWTGSEMIVWGGFNATAFLNTGGRYNPSTDTWLPISNGANVPVGRFLHTGVWTGTELIIWGGETSGETVLNTGARYNPATDTWTPTGTGAGVPSARYYQTAVWTGTEMIVWGGEDAAEALVNTGGRYKPSTNTWAPTSIGANVPAGRNHHSAVWTGSTMIVWGGGIASGAVVNTGGRYNPANNSWTPVSTGANAPSGRVYPSAVWTGTEMIVWGGDGYGLYNTGGRYSPATNTWVPTASGTVVSPRGDASVVWTGSEMIVWGGSEYEDVNTGGAYRPSTDSWMETSGTNTPSARTYHDAVWTGTEMIVWGGHSSSADFNTGGRYNPATNTWTATSTGPNVPAARNDHTTVWTGSQILIWGGTDAASTDFGTGGRYDPSTDSWAAISTGANTPAARRAHTAVWDGTRMIVWGGLNTVLGPLDSGGLYDPATDSWAATTGTYAPEPRFWHTATWTGTQMLVWGGTRNSELNTGGRYDPSADTWTPMSTGYNVPDARNNPSSVWTGEEMIVWGGRTANSSHNTGGRYNPTTDSWTPTSTGDHVPPPRDAHAAAWTGTEMIIWGGEPRTEQGGRYCACPNGLGVYYRDIDEDGHGDTAVTQSACSLHAGYTTVGGDCNDSDPSIYPGAPELNDGVDNQCPGQPGYGIADEIADTLHVGAGGVVSWTDTSGAATFDVARSANSNLSPCDIIGTATSGSPFVTDVEVPPSGTAFYYVVRGASPHVGSWGESSAGVERLLSCP